MILAPAAQKLQQNHLQNVREKGRGNTPHRQVPQKVTLTEKGTIDATVHPPSPPLPLLPKFPHSSSSSSGRHSHRRKHKHHRTRKYSLENYYPGSITCAPPLPRNLQDRIRRGKFVVFDKLLLPQNVPPNLRVKQSGVRGMLRGLEPIHMR